MWQIAVLCSSCTEEAEILIEDLDDLDREVCECGYSFVVLSVAAFEPVYAEGGELIELPRRRGQLRSAA
ncbi:MAG TPA: hypothetical protein VG458_07345 [Solirubrobacterales bacterium]|nr:hypothetical protein [Solirubrobacterales bacterium]